MSGFIAIVNMDDTPVDRDELEQLTNSLHYRGPDHRKVWIDGQVGFGHALFKTTDEAEYEHQPSSLEGAVWITGSGRIDARSDLINKLGLQAEVRLNRTPDSDLILYAYRAWGEKCLDHLLGDFAFVLWDKRKKKLFCARDHFGMRQLYYSHAGRCFLVSNSLHCLLQHPGVSKQLDDCAIGGFLLFGDHTWLDKELTAYTDIKSLLPAHSLVLHEGKNTIRRYWHIPDNIPLLRYRKERDYIDHFLEILKKAISDRLRADRIVISMSGGMDSSSIAAILCEIQEETSQTLHLNAVTVIYKKVHPCREHYFANLVVHHLGLSIQYIDGDQYPFLSQPILTERPLEIEQPSLWLDTLRIERQLGRIVLTGGAGDNLLKYPASFASLKGINPCKLLFHILGLRKRYGKMPGFGTGLRKKLRNLWPILDDKLVTPYPYPSWINNEFETKMCLKELWRNKWTSQQHPSPFHSRHSLLHDSLVKPDWCFDNIVKTSDFTLPEQRDPYLDQRLVKFVLSLPALPWLFNKNILRRTMETKLPAEVVERPKTPLGSLQHSLLKLPNSQWVDEWQPLPELLEYVERDNIPNLAGGRCEPTTSYVNLRPIMLNRWLQNVTG